MFFSKNHFPAFLHLRLFRIYKKSPVRNGALADIALNTGIASLGWLRQTRPNSSAVSGVSVRAARKSVCRFFRKFPEPISENND